MSNRVQGFHVAPFSMDGESMGRGYWNESQLSMGTASICAEMLRAEAAVFQKTLEGSLSHIDLQFTSGNGSAIVTFYVRGNAALSGLMLSDKSPASDQQVADMFLSSVRASSHKLLGSTRPDAFEEIRSLDSKPMLVVIPWNSDMIADEDYSLIQEFCVHLAAAFFGAE